MKYYTVVNEVEALQSLRSVCVYSRSVCVSVLCWVRRGLFVAVIMLPSRRLSRDNDHEHQEGERRVRSQWNQNNEVKGSNQVDGAADVTGVFS